MPLVLWLVQEKGAGVNVASGDGYYVLHSADSLNIVNALLDLGADPNLLNLYGSNALICQVRFSQYDVVVRLLQDPCV